MLKNNKEKSKMTKFHTMKEVRDHMKASGITQREAAARIGIYESKLNMYLNEKQQPTLPTLRRILSAVGLKPVFIKEK